MLAVKAILSFFQRFSVTELGVAYYKDAFRYFFI